MTNEVSIRSAAGESPLLTVPQQLEALAKRANEAHLKVGPAVRSGLLCALEAGQALLEANRICPVGKWLKWLAANFEASRWTALRYMEFAKDCNRLGGNDGATLQHLTPHEADGLLKKLLVLPSGKKARKRAVAPPAALLRSDAAGTPDDSASVNLPAETGRLEPALAAGQSGAEAFSKSEQLLRELIETLRAVACGDDSFHGPLAETLLTDLERAYADLLDFIEIRKENEERR